MAKQLTSFIKSVGQTIGGGSDNLVEFYPVTYAGAEGCNYHRHMTTWCVPPGISKARFRLWGAGGQAAGWAGLACAIVPPSSAGAFAEKQISVTPGDCYVMQVGLAWCATNCRLPCDNRVSATLPQSGLATWVTGNGLTNFCAEGGKDSCTIADCAANLFTDSSTIVWNDSENAPQACYYGADTGARGVNGYMKWNNSNTTDAVCNLRWYIPHPAYTLTKKGGVTMAHNCCYYINNGGVIQGASASLGFPTNRTEKFPNAHLPGMGSAGTANCNSCNTCGGYGTGGKIEIYYS